MFVNHNVIPLTEHVFKPNAELMGATVVAYPMSVDGKETYVLDALAALVSIAQCSEKDSYNKKTGRALAISRALEGEGIVLRFPRGASAEAKRTLIRSIGMIAAGYMIVSN